MADEEVPAEEVVEEVEEEVEMNVLDALKEVCFIGWIVHCLVCSVCIVLLKNFST